MMGAINAASLPQYPPIEGHHGWTLQDWFTGPERWCQHMTKMGKDGREITISSKDNPPVAYDLTGALTAFYPQPKERLEALKRLVQVTGSYELATWNDARSTTFALLQSAIRKANV